MSEVKWRVRENQNGTSELYHYGILGMKWGIRRTPEQLGHMEKRRVEGKPLKYTSRLREEAKGFVKAFGRRTISYFIPEASLIFNAKAISNLSKKLDFKDYEKGTERLSELKRKSNGVKVSIDEDVKEANKTGKKGYVKNCFNCVCALEMRQRGYDVEALPRSYGAFVTDYHDMFRGVKLYNAFEQREKGQSRKAWVMKSYDRLCTELEGNPEGSRGFVGFSYQGVDSGHTIFWAIENGQATFYDPQSGKKSCDKVLSLSDQNYMWGRLDNAEPTEMITQVVGSKFSRKEKKGETK